MKQFSEKVILKTDGSIKEIKTGKKNNIDPKEIIKTWDVQTEESDDLFALYLELKYETDNFDDEDAQDRFVTDRTKLFRKVRKMREKESSKRFSIYKANQKK